MIITIKGTSGSGKTHLAREVMKMFTGQKLRIKKEGRKQPIGYLMYPGPGSLIKKPLAVVGHYETACGGCDTINGTDEIFEYVRKAANEGYHVLYEGLLIAAEVRRTAEICREYPDTLVVALDVPLDVCLASINSRRREKDPTKPDVNPKNTADKHKGIKLCMGRLEEKEMVGGNCEWHSRESALNRIEDRLQNAA